MGKVGIYTRDSDGAIKIRRLIDAKTYEPVPGYTFQGEMDDTIIPPDRSQRQAWELDPNTRRVKVNPAKVRPIDPPRPR